MVEEILNDGILTALESYGLVSAYGEGTEADLKEEMKELLAVSNENALSMTTVLLFWNHWRNQVLAYVRAQLACACSTGMK